MISPRAVYVRGDTSLFIRDLYKPIIPGQRWILATHGHGGSHQTWSPSGIVTYTYKHIRALLEAGFVVFSSDAGGTTNWGGPANQTELDNVYALAQSMGLAVKCDLLAGSMGGMGTLTWMKNNPAKVRSCSLFCPATDLDATHANPAYTSEITAIWPSYPTGATDYDPIDNAASFVGLGIPTRIYHGSADAAVPIQWSIDLVAAAGAPFELITYAGESHLGVFAAVNPTELVRWILAA